MKNGGKNKSVAFIMLFSVDCIFRSKYKCRHICDIDHVKPLYTNGQISKLLLAIFFSHSVEHDCHVLLMSARDTN